MTRVNIESARLPLILTGTSFSYVAMYETNINLENNIDSQLLYIKLAHTFYPCLCRNLEYILLYEC